MQGSANYGPWDTSALLPIFVNKVLFECSHAPLLQQHLVVMTYCEAPKPKIFSIWAFTEKNVLTAVVERIASEVPLHSQGITDVHYHM